MMCTLMRTLITTFAKQTFHTSVVSYNDLKFLVFRKGPSEKKVWHNHLEELHTSSCFL